MKTPEEILNTFKEWALKWFIARASDNWEEGKKKEKWVNSPTAMKCCSSQTYQESCLSIDIILLSDAEN